jgi:Protein of unknown function (DUF1573)
LIKVLLRSNFRLRNHLKFMNRLLLSLLYRRSYVAQSMMRLNSVLVIWIISVGQLAAQSPTEIKGPSITWEKSEHDFGEINQGDKVHYTFRFINTGTEPLIITNVEVTCGCTVPKGWPRDPISPGNKGELEVMFNSSGKFGKQNKVVTVVSNAALGNSQVMFSATILEKKPN